MPERTTKRTRAEQPDDELTAVEPGEVTDLGDAAAVGEHAYAGEPGEWPPDDRPPEQIAGTPEHLGGMEFPYGGARQAAPKS